MILDVLMNRKNLKENAIYHGFSEFLIIHDVMCMRTNRNMTSILKDLKIRKYREEKVFELPKKCIFHGLFFVL